MASYVSVFGRSDHALDSAVLSQLHRAGQRILVEERKQDLREINTPPVIITDVARPGRGACPETAIRSPSPPPREDPSVHRERKGTQTQ